MKFLLEDRLKFGMYKDHTLKEIIDIESKQINDNSKNPPLIIFNTGELLTGIGVLYFEWCILNIASFFVHDEVIQYASTNIKEYELREEVDSANKQKLKELTK